MSGFGLLPRRLLGWLTVAIVAIGGVAVGSGGASAATLRQSAALSALDPATASDAPRPAVLSSPFVSGASDGSEAFAAVGETPAAVAWSVSLTADRTDITEGEQANLTAYASAPVNGSGYDIKIYEFSADFSVPGLVADCSSGSSCPVAVEWSSDPVSYEAFIAPPGSFQDGSAVASSNTVIIPSSGGSSGGGGPEPWQVSLSVSPVLVPVNKPVTVVATANQTVDGTAYDVQIYSLNPDRLVKQCPAGNSCAYSAPWSPGDQAFQAFIATPGSVVYPPAGAVAFSDTVRVTGTDWQVSLGATGDKHMTAVVHVNRPVGPDTSSALMIWDMSSETALAICYTGQNCQATVPGKGDLVMGFVVPADRTNPNGNFLARSQPLTFPSSLYGMSGLSQNSDGELCVCDPINPLDGSLRASVTDFALPGRGPGLVLARTYDSDNAGAVSRFGFGWSDAYALALAAGPNDDGTFPTSLTTAGTIDVVQQDGSVVPFSEQADGTFAAAPSVLASLTRNGDGTYVFVQRKRAVFTFSAYGTLLSEADLHGNATTLSYDSSGRLSTVTDVVGRTLTYAYNAGGMATSVTGPGARAETYGYDASGNLVSATDETGATWAYAYDGNHDMVSMTDPDGRTTRNLFDGLGRVLAQTDGRGATTNFTYNDDGTRVITHPAGDVTTLSYTQGLLTGRTEGAGVGARTWQYLYDPNTLGLAQLTDPDGHVTRYTYDTDGNQTSTTDPDGHTSSVTFDALDDPMTATDADGAVTTMTYDATGDVTSKTDPLGATASYSYDAAGMLTTVVDPDGHTTRFGYNSAGDLTSSTDPEGATTKLVVDALGQTTAVTDPDGRTTSYGFDPRGLLTSATDPTGARTTYVYDAAGLRTSATDATGRTSTFTFDGAAELVRTTNPDGTFVATTYDADGRRSTVSDADGNTAALRYDATGRLVSTTDPTGATIAYAYDPAGLLTASKAPLGGTTSYAYDAAGRTTSVSDATGAMSKYAYDPAGRMTAATDPMSELTGYSYDADGRVIATTQPDGTISRDAYDPAGLATRRVDASGNATSYRYDADGRVVSSTDPDGRTTTFSYDPASRLATSTDAAGRVSTDSYDAAGRLVEVTYSDPNTPSVAYSSDAAGRRLTMRDGTGTTSYGYNAAGQLVSVVDGSGQVVGYSYDPLGRIDAITYPDGRVVTEAHDADGRLTSESDGAGQTTSFAYDGDGNLAATTYPNGVVQQQVFDPADRLTATTVSAGTTTLASFDYQLNADGLATAVDVGGVKAPAPPTQSYGYDPLSRLSSVATSATGSAGGSSAPTGPFSYDPTGNVTGLPDGTTLSYDPASQLTASVGPGAVTTRYGFDATGDRTSATTGGLTSTYAFDQAGQLTGVSVPQRSPSHLLAGGEFFSLAVRGDGSVRAWGDNSAGELGDGGACGATCATQITVPGLPTILQVAAGQHHALAVSTDGRVFAWGANSHGQLGDDTTTASATPVQVPGLADVVAVAAAGDSSYALTRDGKVFAWGENDDGQVGDGTTADSTTPVLVQGLPTVVDISAGALPDGPTHVLAATSAGQVYSWGDQGAHPADPTQAQDAGSNDPGGNGQGDGDPGSDGAGSGTGSGSCKTDNGVGNGGVPGKGNGHDNGGQCKSVSGVGNGKVAIALASPAAGPGGADTAASGDGVGRDRGDDIPILVDGVTGAVEVAAGGDASYALTSNGAVFAWGDNSYGQLGLGSRPSVRAVDVPTQILGLPTVKMVAAGGAHAVVLSTRGQVFGWGDDNTGQIGAAGPNCREADKVCPSPQLIAGVTASAVAAGYVHTLIATVDEHLDGLGRDAEAELGDGYSHPATQVGPPGDRNATDTPDGGVGGAKHDLTEVVGLAQIRPQAPVTAAYTYTGDGLRATSTTTVDDTTTVVPATTRQIYSWNIATGPPELLSDGTHDYLTGPGGQVIEQTDIVGEAPTGGTVFLHADRLGSTRLLTNTAGQPVASYDYTPAGVRIQIDGLGLLPYAQGIPPMQPATAFGFAGAYTDAGTGWVYLQARYYDSGSDQFVSVDPAIALTAQPYAYAGGDPTNLTDPTGLTAGVTCYTQAWVDENSPPGNTEETVADELAVGAAPHGADFWHTAPLPSGGVACYGADGCIEAYDYLGRTHDIAGAKLIAATYCRQHAERCAHDATRQGVTSRTISAIALGFAGGMSLAGPADATAAEDALPEISDANAPHMFRDAPGHLPDSEANRALLQQTAGNPGNLAGTYNGISTYVRQLPDGSQVWVEVRNGQITNGGVNSVPRVWDPTKGKLR